MGTDAATPGKPLRVAVLADPDNLLPGEVRLLERIGSDRHVGLVALLELTADPGAVSGIDRNGRSSKSLLPMVIAVERRLLRRGRTPSKRSCDKLFPPDLIRVRASDHEPCLPASGLERILALELDVIIDLKGVPAARSLAALARHGVWFRSYGYATDNDVPGFRELSDNRGIATVTLRRYAPRSAEEGRITSASYPARTTYTSNIECARDNSAELIWRELRNAQREGRVKLLPMSSAGPVASTRSEIGQVTAYAARLGAGALSAAQRNVAARQGIPTDRWSLFVGKGRYDASDWSQATETRPPRGEYWADPFLFRRRDDTRTYVFFEVFDYRSGKGKISAGFLSDGSIVPIGDALDTGYHLSYPFVFEHDGSIWMIPESHETRRLEIWRCVDFPLRWTLEKTAMEGLSLADSSVCEHDGRWWLFANQAESAAGDHNSELYIYQIDSPMMNVIVPHAGNPVLIDARRGRNGGRIRRENGFLVRPAQNNAFRYGYGLGIYRIRTLTLDAYDEEPIFSVEPDFRPGITCCHHIDACEDIFVFDARRRFG